MSTRSTIAVRNLDGTMQKIYCHWNGYIAGNGVLLQKYYNTPEKIRELLALGNISSLNKKVNPNTPDHSFDHPEEGVVVAYHRDRGEEFCTATPDQMEEFNYVFNMFDGAWYVSYYTDYPDTEATRFLELDYVGVQTEKLLLDAILNCKDQYVDKQTKEDCMAKAKIGKAEADKMRDEYWNTPRF